MNAQSLKTEKIISLSAVFWQHKDVSGKSRRTTDASGAVIGKDGVDLSDVTLQNPLQDPNQQPRYRSGTGGGGKDAGGEVQAKAAQLHPRAVAPGEP